MGPICSTSVHSQIHLHYMCKIDSQSVQPFDHNLPVFLNCWSHKTTHNAALGYRVANCLILCPFPDEFTDAYQIWCQSVQPFDSFPRLLNVWPPNPPRHALLGIDGWLLFSLCEFPDESADVNQSWCHSVQPFESFPWLLNVWPPTPPPRHAPWGIEGWLVFSLCPFPAESADVNQSWCQSVQPFDSFPLTFECLTL